MSLRLKIIFILLLIFVLFLTANQVVEYRIIAPTFAALEKAEARKDMERCVEAMKREIYHLDSLVSEWSDWNDSYDFTEDRNEDYIADNLLEETFSSEEVNLFCIFNKEKQLVFGIVRDSTSGMISTIDDKALALLHEKNLVLDSTNDSPIHGVILFDEKPMIIAARPILTTDLAGPMHGTFILGKELTEDYIKLIADQTKVAFNLWAIDDTEIPETDRAYIETPSNEIVVAPPEKNTSKLLVYNVFPNINNLPVLFMKAEIPRDITAQSAKTIKFAFISFMSSEVLILLIIMLLLQLTVINPITRLTRHAINIGSTDNLSVRLDNYGNDEVGKLSNEFNKMLEKLSQARQKLLEQSFYSGMAELAKGVLHNIGNALNPLHLYIEEIRGKTELKNQEKFAKAVKELLEGNSTEERREDLLKYIQLSVNRLIASSQECQRPIDNIIKQVNIVEDILQDQESFSRAQRTTEGIELTQLLNDSLSLVPIKAKDLLLVEMDESVTKIGRIIVPRVALIQVFANLLTNAAEAKKLENDKISVKISADIKANNGIEMINIHLKDDGKGISKENQQRIFEQGFSTKDRSFSGLGLHWCANTLNSIGVNISVESAGIGEGTCFHILLPNNL